MRRNETVAKRYAKALFQLSIQHADADDIGKPAEVLKELESFQSALKSAELRKFFLSPVISKADKKAMLAELNSNVPSVVKFLQVLIGADRLSAFDSIVSEFKKLHEESTGEMSVNLETAHSLSGPALDEIKSFLESEWGRKIKIQVQKNPSLIGGFVAKSANKTFDASVRFQLENLKQQIVEAR